MVAARWRSRRTCVSREAYRRAAFSRARSAARLIASGRLARRAVGRGMSARRAVAAARRTHSTRCATRSALRDMAFFSRGGEGVRRRFGVNGRGGRRSRGCAGREATRACAEWEGRRRASTGMEETRARAEGGGVSGTPGGDRKWWGGEFSPRRRTGRRSQLRSTASRSEE